MSTRSFGPRVCYLNSPSGEIEKIELSIVSADTYDPPVVGDAMSFTGVLKMLSPSRNSEIKVFATDEILLVGRLVFIAGSQLLGECERGGLTLSTGERPEITEPFGLF